MLRLLNLVFAVAVLFSTPWVSYQTASAGDYWAYFGTYTRKNGSEGVYVSKFDSQTGKLSAPKLAAGGVRNPSFLAVHPSNKLLYSVSEISGFEGKPGGGVTGFELNQQTGLLTKINDASSVGAGPCHLVVDPAGKNVLVANYRGGSVACLPIDKNGRLSDASSFSQHKGRSVKPRQKQPYAHSINLDPAGNFAVVADLGLDKVLIYAFDSEKGQLKKTSNFGQTPLGGGPRHFDFHPSGKFAYTNNEMESSVTVFQYDGKQGKLHPIQTISTLPSDYQGGNSTAELRVHDNGKFVYVSNRGHDSIAVFKVDEKTGKLTAAGHQSTLGKTPRNFCIGPMGKYLLAANQRTDNVVVLKIDQETGMPKPTGQQVKVFSPVCVRFVPAK